MSPRASFLSSEEGGGGLGRPQRVSRGFGHRNGLEVRPLFRQLEYLRSSFDACELVRRSWVQPAAFQTARGPRQHTPMRAVGTIRHRGVGRTAERLLASGVNDGGGPRGGLMNMMRGVACQGQLRCHHWSALLELGQSQSRGQSQGQSQSRDQSQSHRGLPLGRLPSTPNHHDRHHGRHHHTVCRAVAPWHHGAQLRRPQPGYHRHEQWSQERRFATVAPILSSRLFNVLGLYQFDEKELKAAFEAKGG